MRRLTAGIIATAAAIAFTLGASPVKADEEPEPPSPRGGVFANIDIDGVLPVCVNIVSISAFGNELVRVPKTCIG